MLDPIIWKMGGGDLQFTNYDLRMRKAGKKGGSALVSKMKYPPSQPSRDSVSPIWPLRVTSVTLAPTVQKLGVGRWGFKKSTLNGLNHLENS
jgi:hypothetical protein